MRKVVLEETYDVFEKGVMRQLKGFMREVLKTDLTIAITGGQGVGKAMLLKNMNKYIPKKKRIYVKDYAPEIRKKEKKREKGYVSEVSKSDRKYVKQIEKSDVLEFVEVVLYEDMLQILSTPKEKSIIFTHHANTTDDLLISAQNAVMQYGIQMSDSEKDYARGVNTFVDLDIHLIKDEDGKRYIESIKEIVPCKHKERSIVNTILELDKENMRYVVNTRLAYNMQDKLGEVVYNELDKALKKIAYNE